VKKTAEQILKYKDLTKEIQRMRDIKKEIPVIISADGTSPKSLTKNPET